MSILKVDALHSEDGGSSNIELEIMIVVKEDLENILLGTPMEFNTL